MGRVFGLVDVDMELCACIIHYVLSQAHFVRAAQARKQLNEHGFGTEILMDFEGTSLGLPSSCTLPGASMCQSH